jgi:hypothetical protein
VKFTHTFEVVQFVIVEVHISIIFQVTLLFHQDKAFFKPSSQYHIHTSILSTSYHLSHADTIAHHLSAITHVQIHSKYIFVQKEYFDGQANIQLNTSSQDAHLIHLQFNFISSS